MVCPELIYKTLSQTVVRTAVTTNDQKSYIDKTCKWSDCYTTPTEIRCRRWIDDCYTGTLSYKCQCRVRETGLNSCRAWYRCNCNFDAHRKQRAWFKCDHAFIGKIRRRNLRVVCQSMPYLDSNDRCYRTRFDVETRSV